MNKRCSIVVDLVSKREDEVEDKLRFNKTSYRNNVFTKDGYLKR